MIPCPSCSSENAEANRFCSNCGNVLRPESEVTEPDGWVGIPSSERPESSIVDSSPRGRFLPGTRIASRYRIVSLLGRGGMGEVYRAEDLRLGQTVALKFLPPELGSDPVRLDCFHNEVKLARGIAHPNVCRVYDIGEVDGLHFLSMEFIDGEDLRVLLRRIGRLPAEKGNEIAVQLCAAIGAAHERGVIHRDLKPANVMIDGRGRVRITDFGLAWESRSEVAGSDRAATAGELPSDRSPSDPVADWNHGKGIVGTPAYMAPEQLLVGETSVQSDLYSLGLILYELFTGKSPLENRTAGELRRLYQKDSAIAPPSDVLSELDPAVEQAIMRCLARNPRDRPSSVAGVAAALPGGDPLAVALAAGETPSPAVVAAAGSRGGLHPGIGGILVALVFIQWLTLGWQFDHASVLGILRGQMEEPAVMESHARKVLADLGYTEPPFATASSFVYNREVLFRLRKSDPWPNWQELREIDPTPIYFLYRESPHPLASQDPSSLKVKPLDPPLDIPGMAMVNLDLKKRMRRLWVVPPLLESESNPVREPDWKSLLAAAGIAPESLQPCESVILPPRYADTRMAWEGVLDQDEGPVHVEAAFYRGRPISFRIVTKENLPKLKIREPTRGPDILTVAFFLFVAVVEVSLMLRNFRSGRVDWKGAMRLSVIVYCAVAITHIFSAESVAHIVQNPGRILRMLLSAASLPLIVFALYTAIEPLVRRLWPQTLIAWTRVLAGDVFDPLVGRELVFGCALGGMSALALRGFMWFANEGISHTSALQAVLGGRQTLGILAGYLVVGLVGSLVLMLVLLVLRLILKRGWLALIAFVGLPALLLFIQLLASPESVDGEKSVIGVALMILLASGIVLGLTRLGLLATMAAMFCYGVMLSVPISLDTSSWFWEHSSLLALIAVVSLSIFGFMTSYWGWATSRA